MLKRATTLTALVLGCAGLAVVLTAFVDGRRARRQTLCDQVEP